MNKGSRVYNDVLECIGQTPLVRLDRFARSQGLECELYGKCEYFNPGGSVKDRIALKMIDEAEKSGVLKPGISTLIEPTSGNTGIGLALGAVLRGYRCIITMPEKMSLEKVNTLKALGAEIIRTPTEAAWDAPESHIGVALRLNREIKDSVILNQYDNPYNPIAHYEHTGAEIVEAIGAGDRNKKVDMFVAGAGTGGTITGAARKIKEHNPECVVVGADPVGSILATPQNIDLTQIKPYLVEGIGYDFVPKTLDHDVIDMWVKTNDTASFLMARKLIREEGLLCGGSSGAAMYAAVEAIKAKGLGAGKTCVVILPDSIKNYMSKFLDDQWLVKNKIVDKLPVLKTQEPVQSEGQGQGQGQGKSTGTGGDAGRQTTRSRIYSLEGATVRDLNLQQASVVSDTTSIGEASQLMVSEGFDMVPVISHGDSSLKGFVTLGNIVSYVTSGRVSSPSAPVSEVMFKFNTRANNSNTHTGGAATTTAGRGSGSGGATAMGGNKYREIDLDTPLSSLEDFFERHSAAIVTERVAVDSERVAFRPIHILTAMDIITFAMRNQKN